MKGDCWFIIAGVALDVLIIWVWFHFFDVIPDGIEDYIQLIWRN